jgi:hypothetical protein
MLEILWELFLIKYLQYLRWRETADVVSSYLFISLLQKRVGSSGAPSPPPPASPLTTALDSS